MTEIASFGIPELDRLLGGGLVVGSINYMEAERGAQEMSFVAAFLNEGLRQGNFCGIRLYDLPPETLIDRLTEVRVNAREALDSGSMIIADLWGEGEYDAERRGPILRTNNLSDPNSAFRLYLDVEELARRRIESGKSSGLRIVTYSASTVVMNYKFEATYRLTKAARARVRLNKGIQLITFNPRMFDETVVASLEDTCDSIISLTVKEARGRYQRFIRVKQSPIPNYQMDEVPYDIVDGKPMLKLY